MTGGQNESAPVGAIPNDHLVNEILNAIGVLANNTDKLNAVAKEILNKLFKASGHPGRAMQNYLRLIRHCRLLFRPSKRDPRPIAICLDETE